MWMASANVGGQARKIARKAEAEGFDGVSFGDTECQNPDAFVGLALAAGATSEIRLGIGVTNPVIRHPAALGCAMATIQLESGGRAVLGIGRGDSAVTKVGLRASTVSDLELFLSRLQRYLSGEVVSEDGPLAQLTWTAPLSVPKVPVDVAASGPGVIAAGARLAERVTFNVGADPDRLRSCIELARASRLAAGLPPDGLSVGAYLNVAPHPDAATARELVKPVVAVYARFSNSTRPGEGLAAGDVAVVQAVAENYDMSRHGHSGATHLAYLTDDFVDRFAVAGTPEHCVDRLTELAAMGLERFAIVGPTRDAEREVVAASRRLLSEVVLPAVRANADGA
jgi:5,10-methylenetetrahydromethanopterin reductase